MDERTQERKVHAGHTTREGRDGRAVGQVDEQRDHQRDAGELREEQRHAADGLGENRGDRATADFVLERGAGQVAAEHKTGGKVQRERAIARHTLGLAQRVRGDQRQARHEENRRRHQQQKDRLPHGLERREPSQRTKLFQPPSHRGDILAAEPHGASR